MLVSVFGIWMSLLTITHLSPPTFGLDGCSVHFIGDKIKFRRFEDKTCDELAAEINRIAKETTHD